MSNIKKLQSLLRITPNQRLPHHLKQLKSMTSHVELFKRLTLAKHADHLHRDFCRYLEFKEYRPGSQILTLGEHSDRLVYILSGAIVCYTSQNVQSYLNLNLKNINISPNSRAKQIKFNSMLKPLKLLQQTPKILKEPQMPNLSIKQKAEVFIARLAKQDRNLLEHMYAKELDEQSMLIQDYYKKEHSELIESSVLSQKKCFGETALLSNIPGTITVRALDAVKTFTLSKQDFNRVCDQHIRREFEEKISALKEFPVFSIWTKLILYKISELFHKRIYFRGQQLYKQGQPLEYIYFVNTGEVRVILIQLSESFIQQSRTIVRQKDAKMLKLSQARVVDQATSFDICTKGSHQILGVEQCVKGETLARQSCECVSQEAEIFLIKREVKPIQDFVERVMPRPESSHYFKSLSFPTRQRIVPKSPVVKKNRRGLTDIDFLMNFIEKQRLRSPVKDIKRYVSQTPVSGNSSCEIERTRPNGIIPPIEYHNRKYFKRKPAKRYKYRRGAPPNFLTKMKNGGDVLCMKLRAFEDLIPVDY